MSPRCPHRRRHALLVGLVCLSVCLGGWIVWIDIPWAQRSYGVVPREPLITEMTVDWLGSPVVSSHLFTNAPDEVKLLGRFEVEIGLREDGVVVWRKMAQGK